MSESFSIYQMLADTALFNHTSHYSVTTYPVDPSTRECFSKMCLNNWASSQTIELAWYSLVSAADYRFSLVWICFPIIFIYDCPKLQFANLIWSPHSSILFNTSSRLRLRFSSMRPLVFTSSKQDTALLNPGDMVCIACWSISGADLTPKGKRLYRYKPLCTSWWAILCMLHLLPSVGMLLRDQFSKKFPCLSK